MLEDLTRSVKEAVSDGYNSPETTTPSGFFGNILKRFKGRLLFSFVFFIAFALVAMGIVLMILVFVLKSL